MALTNSDLDLDANSGQSRTGGMPAVKPPPLALRGTAPRGGPGPAGETPLAVGVIAPSYGLEHVSYGVPVPGVSFCTLKVATARRLETRSQFFAHTPLVIGPRVDLVHSLNHLPLQVPTRRPFVVSAELEMPRLLGSPASWQTRFALEALESSACRRILPLSQAAMRFMVRRFEAAGRGHLADKTEIFRGAVLPPPALRITRDPAAPIRFLFVGGDGLRKGLGAAVEAVRRLNAVGIDTHLTAIGRPTETTYAIPGTTIPSNVLRRALADSPFVTHFPKASNAEVRSLMTRADALLLPTADESLGWVVIEAGLTGLAVAATGIFAIPELVEHGTTGWLLGVETDKDDRWAPLGKPEAKAAWAGFQEGLIADIVAFGEAIAADPALPDCMGANARERLEPMYLPQYAAPRLRAIYEAALASDR